MADPGKEHSTLAVALAVTIAVLGGYILYYLERRDVPPTISIVAAGGSSAEEAETMNPWVKGNKSSSICVHVCGEVNNPGVYMLPEGSIVVRAIEAAGGVTAGADCRGINLAQKLSDQAKILVPAIPQQEVLKQGEPGACGKPAPGAPARVNINSASLEELDRLPGVGAATASRIIEYRRENGSFSGIEELKNIPGIRKKVVEQWEPYLEF
ncbi:MAG: helix-hairpin-helix domain-containing protein [Candidatus Eremiobacteraeota bacterium]|nr:helix-hairpin-helix domain-containing protein [Candidatus Eremiobacteraeota bacterium]